VENVKNAKCRAKKKGKDKGKDRLGQRGRTAPVHADLLAVIVVITGTPVVVVSLFMRRYLGVNANPATTT
jgi:hypothetical protein